VSPQEAGARPARATLSRRALRSQALRGARAGAGGGAVSRMKRSTAAMTAAASAGEALVPKMVS